LSIVCAPPSGRWKVDAFSHRCAGTLQARIDGESMLALAKDSFNEGS
jgi:hypothetical protein